MAQLLERDTARITQTTMGSAMMLEGGGSKTPALTQKNGKKQKDEKTLKAMAKNIATDTHNKKLLNTVTKGKDF